MLQYRDNHEWSELSICRFSQGTCLKCPRSIAWHPKKRCVCGCLLDCRWSFSDKDFCDSFSEQQPWSGARDVTPRYKIMVGFTASSPLYDVVRYSSSSGEVMSFLHRPASRQTPGDLDSNSTEASLRPRYWAQGCNRRTELKLSTATVSQTRK